ncbi:hypothetical protein C5167_012460 [Papaver somniferum]|uniref:HNH nuclease domain-containing protein n=1 Tax=Papaver somniferum TaxID=3469 RepID=A0A4Y7IXJ4_PAPSO|nr:titin homolog [Papaver somniferum]RZC53614.1 hypothetical protein C5167_012460 [Papaver somniferum]
MGSSSKYRFNEEDMVIDECLGYPKSYSKLCRDVHLNNPYKNGPPFSFIPYVLQPQEVSREEELDQIFPITNPEAKPSTKPKIYANLLWKQLNHLGNAGFDPTQFRVDPYGNVLYYHADAGSPLAWEIDHWFPCSRGGRTVPSNLRLLQWQVCKKKQNKLEFLVPWWDLQVGISVNQFLSIFASTNSDFRNRAFSLLFADGGNEELSSMQTVESHAFPTHFCETKQKVGLAPAAIVSCRKEGPDSSSVLRNVDLNRSLRPSSPATAKSSHRPSYSKENENANPYLTIAMARDSLRRKDETQVEIRKLDDELDDLKQKNEEERVALQDLESVLIKRRRRTEKCRRLAEAQSSYKALLEKMIRDAMHQSVMYKEQARLNQAATAALMARLEAQKAICDTSEKDLHRKYKQRDEIETQIRPHPELARKRSRNDDFLSEERNENDVIFIPEVRPWKPLQKELRVFLEEEQKASEASLALMEEREREEHREELLKGNASEMRGQHNVPPTVVENGKVPVGNRFQEQETEDEKKNKKIASRASSVTQSPGRHEEDEESRKQRGKGNVEKWLQMLLDDTKEENSTELPNQIADENDKTDKEMREKLNFKIPKDIRTSKFPASTSSKRAQIDPVRDDASGTYSVGKGIERRKSFQGKERRERSERDKEIMRCESARAFRPIPHSPSVILRMTKNDCLGKKPVVNGSDENLDDRIVANNFIKSSIKTLKKAVQI